MKKSYLILILTGMFFSSVQSRDFVSVQNDISNGLPVVTATKNAKKEKIGSAKTVNDLVASNVDVVRAVQTVAKTWNSCDDTYSAVQAGVKANPERAAEIVASIATMKNCNCNAQSFWARSRLVQRLRPSIQRSLVEVSSSCGCAAAGIEAAMEVVPDKAEEMIKTALVAKNRAERTVDSIGKIGQLPESQYWGDSQVKTKGSNLVRNQDVCKGDHNELDDFSPKSTWSNGNDSNNNLSPQSKGIGFHNLSCNNQQDSDDEFGSSKLLISQYVQQDSDQLLELYNNSDEPIDLLMDNYQVEVYFHGYDFPGTVVQLNGLVQPKSAFVVSAASSSQSTKSKTDQVVHGLSFKGADAVTLKNGFKLNECECSSTTVAAALNGSAGGSKSAESISPEKQDLIELLKNHYDNEGAQVQVVDSLGQVKSKSSADQSLAPIGDNMNLRRFANTCKGDQIEFNEFNPNTEWSSYSKDDFKSVGKFQASDCEVTREDLILTEYLEGDNNNNFVEFYNGSQRPINFNKEDYYLEIFDDNSSTAKQRIKLTGQVLANTPFVVAHSQADDRLKNMAGQLTAELDLEGAKAVVLKKIAIPAFQSCQAGISDFVQNTNLFEPIIYILDPTFDPGTGPDGNDDPRDGDDGGQLASPN